MYDLVLEDSALSIPLRFHIGAQQSDV